MSLLMAHGHPSAPHYPIGVLWQEAAIVGRRVQGERAADARLAYLMHLSLPNDGMRPESTKANTKTFIDMTTAFLEN